MIPIEFLRLYADKSYDNQKLLSSRKFITLKGLQ